MNSSIRLRLLRAEDHLLSAVSEDVSTLDTFYEFWETLLDDLNQAVHSRSVDDETVVLANAITSKVEILYQGFLDFRKRSDEITFKLMSELNDIFSHFSVVDVLSPPRCTLSDIDFPISLSSFGIRDRDSPDTCAPSPFPPYIPPAYKWLLKNLHDPYPSIEIKQSISDNTGASLGHVNAWFTNVRRRMGWTALSRKYFSGNRTETVDAAYRALVTEDPKRPLESDITLEFMAVKVAAEGLYSEKFRKSVLAGKLDVVVKDLTEEDRTKRELTKVQAIEDDKRRKEKEKEVRRKERANDKSPKSKKLVKAQSSYPSPHRSPCSSPEPSSPLESCEEDLSPPKPVAGRKRRASSSSCSIHSVDDGCDAPRDRPNKRSRIIHSSSKPPFEPSITFPPSPQSPSVETNAFEFWTTEPSPPMLSLRKRRLSDADTQPALKRPRGLAAGPRLQTVSDPQPVSSAIVEASNFDDWFQAHFKFDVPDPVTAEDLESSTTPVDVEVFNNWMLLGVDNVDSSAMGKPVTAVPVQRLEPLDSELHLITSDPFDLTSYPVLVGGTSVNLDLLCHPIAPELDSSKSISTEDLLEFNKSSASSHGRISPPTTTPFGHLFNVECLLSLPKSSVTLPAGYQPIPPQSSASSLLPCFDPVEPVDYSWAQFPATLPSDCTSSLSNSSQAFFDDIMLQELPDIDPSLFLSLSPSPTSLLNQCYEASKLAAEKQAKLERLQQHREEVRKLEAELAI